MKTSVQIGKLSGIPLFLHWTFLLIPGYILLSGLAMGRPAFGMLADLTFVMVIFTCVVLHELGHAIAARKFGVRTRDIILMPIGGVARLERIPRRPREELIVALAGPAVNVVLAASLLALTLPVFGVDGLVVPTSFTANLVGKAIAVNLAMIVFNMLPAFPLDGGRVLRAVLSSSMGHLKATRAAAKTGQAMAVLFGLAGLFVLHNPMLVFIAGFVYLGAAQEAGAAESEASLQGLTVENAMITRFDAIPAQASAEWALRFAMSASQREFPVVSSGRLVGVLRLAAAAEAVAGGRSDVAVDQICERDVATVKRHDALATAILLLQTSELECLPVVDESPHLEGLISRDSIRSAARFGPLVRRLATSPLRDSPDELRQHLTRLQLG